jgi:regulator of sigma E protease
MWSILFAIFSFLLTIFIVAGVHEFGHFVLARIFKIRVIRFSIGFGKVLWRTYDKRGTEYAISLFPIGGYVKLLDSREDTVVASELGDTFDGRPIYQRFCVLIAGPVFNFILAVLAFWIIFIHGVVYIKPIVGQVVVESLAAQAGIKPQDEIVAVNKHNTITWTAVAMDLIRHYGDTEDLIITTRSSSQQMLNKHTLKVNPLNWHLDALKPDILQSIGIEPYVPTALNKKDKIEWPATMLESTHYNVISALPKAIEETSYFISFNIIILYKMITGVISWHGLSGPVGIFKAASGAARQGFIIYLNFLALISIGIGLLNLLPIPGLDGAQIVYLLYELVKGKPMSVAAQVFAFRLGIILLIIIMLQALLNDLLRLN